MWEGCDVVSERQKLHSLLPNSWGAERRHPDELLWGDHRQSLGECIHMVCSTLVAIQDIQASPICVRWILALKLSWKSRLCFFQLFCFLALSFLTDYFRVFRHIYPYLNEVNWQKPRQTNWWPVETLWTYRSALNTTRLQAGLWLVRKIFFMPVTWRWSTPIVKNQAATICVQQHYNQLK